MLYKFTIESVYLFNYFIYRHHLLFLCFILYNVRGGDNMWEWLQKILFPKGKKKKNKKGKKGDDK